jgi:phospholipid transport system substrate-binding protein
MKSITVKPLLKVTAFLCLSFATLLTAQAFEMDSPSETDIADSEATYSNQAVNKTNPYKMIKTVAGLTFARFANESENIKKDPNILKDVVAEELMPYINYKYSAFKVIGKHLRNTTKEDREAFVPVFRDYLVTSYAQVFTLYDNQQVLFSPEQRFNDKNIVSVKTQIVMPGRDNIDVSFKVRINKKTKEWKAYDMVAEGVSLLDSKQAELGGLIRQKGLPYVTEMLKEKSKRDIVFKNEKG